MVNEIWTYRVIGAGNSAFGAEVRPDSGAYPAPTARFLQMPAI